eukprot:gene22299-23410_t
MENGVMVLMSNVPNLLWDVGHFWVEILPSVFFGGEMTRYLTYVVKEMQIFVLLVLIAVVGAFHNQYSTYSTRSQQINMAKKSVGDLGDNDLRGKRVFVRADFNVPLDKKTGKITDDTRIRGAIPTIQYLTSKAPVAPRLSELLGQDVKLVPDCVENVRFYPEEEKNNAEFAAKLAANADVYVNDAFGTAHRAHGSTEGVAKYLSPAVAGFLLQKELNYLQGAVEVPKRPFAAIVGGSKVSSKISVIESMLHKVDKLVLGGGMVFTFLKARGISVGSSLVEDDQLELARKLEKLAAEKGVQLFLASDVVIADKFA